MSEIQVITTDLRSGSQSLDGAGKELWGVKSQVSGIPGSVGNAYDGQLQQALQGILGGAAQTAAQLQSRSVDLGDELLSRAAGFEAANEAAKGSVLGASSNYMNFIETIKRLGFLSFLSNLKEKALLLWSMGGLTTGLMSWLFAKPEIVTPFATSIFQPTASVGYQSESNKERSISKSPVQGVNPVITQAKHTGGASKEGDRGVAIDIGADNPNKAEIHNMVAGKVVGIGPDLDEKGNLHDYGNYVKVLQDDNTVVLYAHLKDQPSNIKVGDHLESSQTIGTMGSTGRSTGPHLHLEFREPKFDNNGNYIGDSTGFVKNNFDPIEYLKNNGIEF